MPPNFLVPLNSHMSHSKVEDTNSPQIYDVQLISFGYSNGQPTYTDQNYNLRKLPNPPKSIRDQHTGLYKPLQEDIFTKSEVIEKYEFLCTELEGILEDASDDVALGFGCHSGKHRSVAMVERLFMYCLEQDQWKNQFQFYKIHRDIDITGTRKDKTRRTRKDKTAYRQ